MSDVEGSNRISKGWLPIQDHEKTTPQDEVGGAEFDAGEDISLRYGEELAPRKSNSLQIFVVEELEDVLQEFVWKHCLGRIVGRCQLMIMATLTPAAVSRL